MIRNIKIQAKIWPHRKECIRTQRKEEHRLQKESHQLCMRSRVTLDQFSNIESQKLAGRNLSINITIFLKRFNGEEPSNGPSTCCKEQLKKYTTRYSPEILSVYKPGTLTMPSKHCTSQHSLSKSSTSSTKNSKAINLHQQISTICFILCLTTWAKNLLLSSWKPLKISYWTNFNMKTSFTIYLPETF